MLRTLTKSLLRPKQFSFYSVTNKNLSASELSKTLFKELKYEKDQGVEDKLPETVQEFLKKSGFQLKAKDGESVVELLKKGEEEDIRVVFNVVPEVFDNDLESESEEEEEEMVDDVQYDVTVDIIKKDGVLTIFGQPAENWFNIQQIEFSPDSKIALGESVEAEFERKTKYMGPKFEELDEDLQDAFYNYLTEKLDTTSLNDFIYDYSEWKEHREYMNWLAKVGDFVKKQ